MTSGEIQDWKGRAAHLERLVALYRSDCSLYGVGFLCPWLDDIKDRIARFSRRLELERPVDMPRSAFPVEVQADVKDNSGRFSARGPAGGVGAG